MERKHRIEEDKLVDTKKQKLDTENVDEFDDLEDTIQYGVFSSKTTNSDLYLDTINRKILNFDLPIECSSSLATTNIHICLVCNKYLQGVSINSPAYRHSIDSNHHIFINTENSNFIILPEHLILDEERSKDLNDIKLLLEPKFEGSDFDKVSTFGHTLNGEKYQSGFIPLVNDIQVHGNERVIAHNMLYYSLTHISLFRDLLLSHKQSDSTPFTNEMSKLTKKIWSKYLFKNNVSTYSIENSVSKVPASITNDLRMYYLWLINTIIKEEKRVKVIFTGKLELNGKQTKFINLTVALPQPSVFKDGTSSSIEQFALEQLISEKKISIIKSPKVLVIYIDRSNNMKIEGIEQTLNMNVLKYNPDSLKIGSFVYRLAANITYDNKVHVLDKSNDSYKEFDGVSVKDIEKELLFISNCKLQFWELI